MVPRSAHPFTLAMCLSPTRITRCESAAPDRRDDCDLVVVLERDVFILLMHAERFVVGRVSTADALCGVCGEGEGEERAWCRRFRPMPHLPDVIHVHGQDEGVRDGA